MKLIKCLKKHCLTDYVCLVLNGVTPHFYTVNYILQNKSNLLKRPFGIPAIKKSEILDCINKLKKSCYNI